MHVAKRHIRVALHDLPPQVLRAHGFLTAVDDGVLFRNAFQDLCRGGPIDYDRHAHEFNKAFFARNFLKCYLYLAWLPKESKELDKAPLDVGGGAGAFALAAWSCNTEIRAQIVDRSHKQLSIARLLSENIGADFISAYHASDIFDFSFDKTSTRMMSYWVCESSSLLDCFPERRLSVFGPRCIIVDYPDIVLRESEIVRSFGGVVTNLITTEVVLCSQLERLLGQRTIKFGGACLEFRS